MALRVVHISDTHMDHRQLKMPDGDILVHTGDISGITNSRELIEVNNWFASMEGKYREIFLVPGNHDGQFEQLDFCKNILTNCTVLFDNMVEFDGYKIYGSPWTLTFFDWWFMKDPDQIQEVWDKIPDDVNILLTHQPPYLLLDRATEVIRSKRNQDNSKKIINVGCKALRQTCMTRLKKLQLNCFGHLHMDGGKTVDENGIVFSNGAVLNDYYFMSNGPNVIDLP